VPEEVGVRVAPGEVLPEVAAPTVAVVVLSRAVQPGDALEPDREQLVPLEGADLVLGAEFLPQTREKLVT
jgi:hypothetical protein